VRRFRRRARDRASPLNPFANDVIGYPGVREINREHRDVPLSRRGRLIFYSILVAIGLAFVLLFVLTR
jgi:hypothetical protein